MSLQRKVFIVDDHPLVREGLAALINQEPDLTVCGEADNAPQALGDILEANPDIAVIDLSLKGSSGLELIKTLKVRCPRVATLVYSMHDEKQYAERAIRAGALGYVMKRDSTRRLIAAIRQILEGRPCVSEEVAVALAQRFMHMGDGTPTATLSDRELEVFTLLGQGLETRQIAERIHVSIKTVQAYCARIKEKLHLSTATELLREAVRWHERSLTE